jgi:hypothetical protein
MSQKLNTKPDESTVLLYIEAATSASDRVRTVLIVMVTASVLAFVGFINSSPRGGWLDHRINIRKDALRLFDPAFDPNSPNLTPEEKERYSRAKKYLDNAKLDVRNADDKKQVEGEVTELRKVRIEKIRLIQLPFFGAAFDMNDMGIFAGITFAVVLFWLRYSLARQLTNFRMAFKVAEGDREQLKVCYDLLGMKQMLTIPPMPGEKWRRLWSFGAKLLFLIPVFILANLLKLNWQSREAGKLLSPVLMSKLLQVNAAAVVVCLILTLACLYLSWQSDKVWVEQARKVYPDG